ncbi:MAG: hypothetical protein JKY04_05455 [Sneathiella sp.]|nr:hypothetical protein [Sneathiella sp.]
MLGAAERANQTYLRDRQKKRMRDKITGIIVATLFVASGLGYIAYVDEQQNQTKELLRQTYLLLGQKDFETAVLKATEAIEKGHYESRGYYTRAIAHIHLGKIEEAKKDSRKAVSVFAPGGLTFRSNLMHLFILTHHNSLTSDKILTAIAKKRHQRQKTNNASVASNERKYLEFQNTITQMDKKDICYMTILVKNNKYVRSRYCISAETIKSLK